MCWRYVIPDREAAERALAPAKRWWRFAASFNVAPGRYVPAIRLFDGQSEAVMMRWGLIPRDIDGVRPRRTTSAVAAADLLRHDDCRAPWLAGQRCLVPLAGFYLWRLTPARFRQPYYAYVADEPVLAAAAVWERSEDEEGDVAESLALVTVPAPAPLADLAARVPAILDREDHETWLRASPEEAMALAVGASRQPFRHHPVGPRVNVPALDDPSLIEPVEPSTFPLGASFSRGR